MPSPTAKLQDLMFAIRWEADDLLFQLEQYVAGELPAAPQTERRRRGCEDVDFSKFSKQDISKAVESERIFRATTVDQWVEIAQDNYKAITGRRPPLFTEFCVNHWKENWEPTNRYFDPELMLNAVLLFAKDKTVDHTTFESMPYSDIDEEVPGRSWCRYEQKATDEAYGVEVFVRVFPDEEIIVRKKEPQPEEPETVGCPNCAERVHMPARAFLIWDFARGCAGADNAKEIWLSTRVVMERTGIGDNKTVRKYVNLLVDTGWLFQLRAPTKGVGGEGRYRVVEHDEWIAAHGTRGCVQVSPEEAARKRAKLIEGNK